MFLFPERRRSEGNNETRFYRGKISFFSHDVHYFFLFFKHSFRNDGEKGAVGCENLET